FEGTQPPWHALVQSLIDRPGVEEVDVIEDTRIAPQIQTIGDKAVTIQVELFDRAVVVTYNRLNLSESDLSSAIKASGFGVQAPEQLSRVGGQIVIPRDVTD